MTALPTLFVSHGAPALLSDPGPTRDFLGQLGRDLPRPAAILCVSAHWTTEAPCVGGSDAPETIHDFYGFPAELYTHRYPAPGDSRLAARVVDLLAGLEPCATVDAQRGLDHGAWVPLMMAWPDADIPVVQLSVQPRRDPAWHYEVGRRLRPLRDDGVLIVASGGATHNLSDFGRYPLDAVAQPYARAFDEWLAGCIADGDVAALNGVWEAAPEALHNHPSPEHLLPLYIALGSAGDPRGRRLHDTWTYGVLSMAAYAWS